MLQEPSKIVLSVWVSVIAGLAGFFLTAWAAVHGATARFDETLLLALRNPDDLSDAWGPGWFEEAAAEFTALGGYPILVTVMLVALVSLWLLHKRHAVYLLAAAIASGTIVSTLMKSAFDRARPELVEHMDRVFTASFPSGHSMASMLAWLTLAAVAVRFIPRRSLRVFIMAAAFALSVLVGLSRIYLGVHWPSDVLAGWCLGPRTGRLSWMQFRTVDPAHAAPTSIK